MLEQMVRRLGERLKHENGYEPINTGAVLDIAERLRWAAEEAIRIKQSLNSRKGA